MLCRLNRDLPQAQCLASLSRQPEKTHPSASAAHAVNECCGSMHTLHQPPNMACMDCSHTEYAPTFSRYLARHMLASHTAEVLPIIHMIASGSSAHGTMHHTCAPVVPRFIDEGF